MLNPYENVLYLKMRISAWDWSTQPTRKTCSGLFRQKAVPYFNSDNCNAIHSLHLLEHMRARSRRGSRIQHHVLSAGQSSTEGAARSRRWTFCRKLTIILTTAQFCAGLAKRLWAGVRDLWNLSLIVPQTCELFACQMIANQVKPFAAERKPQLRIGFAASDEILMAVTIKTLHDYYVLHKFRSNRKAFPCPSYRLLVFSYTHVGHRLLWLYFPSCVWRMNLILPCIQRYTQKDLHPPHKLNSCACATKMRHNVFLLSRPKSSTAVHPLRHSSTSPQQNVICHLFHIFSGTCLWQALFQIRQNALAPVVACRHIHIGIAADTHHCPVFSPHHMQQGWYSSRSPILYSTCAETSRL